MDIGLFCAFQSMFFFLAQTEQGDIFKITLETDEDMVSTAEYDNKARCYLLVCFLNLIN